MKKNLLQLFLVFALAGCGGGGAEPTAPLPSPVPRLVGEVFGSPEEVRDAELFSNIGYSGNVGALETAREIQRSGRKNMLDFLFLFPMNDAGSIRLIADAESKLDRYIAQNKDLLEPGVRVYLIDEMYLRAAQTKAGTREYQAQLEGLASGSALVRRKLPEAKLGISFSPYAYFADPAVKPFVEQAIAQVDWVGTTTYWLGDETVISALHDWSRMLPATVKAAKPSVETWYIAQAFRDPSWDRQLFRSYMETELRISDQYDAIIFFGWQETSELSKQSAGRLFEPETRAVYNKFLVQ